MHRGTVSTPWTRALPTNKQEDSWEPIYVLNAPPDAANPLMRNGFNTPGCVNMGQGGGEAPLRLMVMPYCEGPPGSIFWMRAYGWRPIGTDESNPRFATWVFNLLVEFVCVAGDLHGPQPIDNVQTTNFLLPVENLCDSMQRTSGILGLNGFVNSDAPGSGTPAYAAFEIYGAKKVSFDFAFPRDVSHVGMNCFYARL